MTLTLHLYVIIFALAATVGVCLAIMAWIVTEELRRRPPMGEDGER